VRFIVRIQERTGETLLSKRWVSVTKGRGKWDSQPVKYVIVHWDVDVIDLSTLGVVASTSMKGDPGELGESPGWSTVSRPPSVSSLLEWLGF
jgi:hypothetical protein